MKQLKKAVLTMGLPASGKSTTVFKKYDMTQFVNIDCDEIKKQHPDYNPKNPSIVHEWSKKMEKQLIANTISSSKNMVIDGTGTNCDVMLNRIKTLQSENYHVELLYCKVALETAIYRNSQRERVVPAEIIFEKFNVVEETFSILQNVANSVVISDNN